MFLKLFENLWSDIFSTLVYDKSTDIFSAQKKPTLIIKKNLTYGQW